MLNQSLFVKDSTLDAILSLAHDISTLNRCRESVLLVDTAVNIYSSLLCSATPMPDCALLLAHTARAVLEAISTDDMYQFITVVRRNVLTNGWRYIFPSPNWQIEFTTAQERLNAYIHPSNMQDLEIIAKTLNVANTLLDELSAMELCVGKNLIFSLSSVFVIKTCGQTSYLSLLEY